MSRGIEAFDALYQAAQLLSTGKLEVTQLTYPSALQVNRRYLARSIPDSAKLVTLKSPKGTGKTQFLESVVSDAIATGQWVLVIGHRQLLSALCHRFSIPYRSQVVRHCAVLGYGLCVDSLHPESQA